MKVILSMTCLMDKTGILSESAIDKNDEIYKAWTTEESISLQEYLTYAASQNWIDISQISTQETYLDSSRYTRNWLHILWTIFPRMRISAKLCIIICCWMMRYPEEICVLFSMSREFSPRMTASTNLLWQER